VRITLFDFEKGTREPLTNLSGELKASAPVSLGALNYGNYRIVDKQRGLLIPIAQAPRWRKKSRDDSSPPSIEYFSGIDKISAGGAVSFEEYTEQWKKLRDGRGSKLAETSISIIHVYDHIRKLGASKKPQDKSGIRELHFLSHAFREGPILVNTPDLRELIPEDTPDPLDALRRDPFDKDGRANKDFNEANYTRAQLEQFRMAFSDDAFVFVWGCDATFFWKELIRQTKMQQDKGAIAFQFTYSPCWGDKDDFDKKMDDAGKPKRFNLEDIRRLIHDEMDATYLQVLSDAIRKPVIGALPGTGSDHDRDAPAEKLLWHVSISGKDSACLHPDNWKKWLDFYRDELKVTFDKRFTFDLPVFKTEFGRGFAVFKPLTSS
jgi:hypothetical protein